MPAWPPHAPRGRRPWTALHPLLGIPVALKDLVSVRGGQCTAGSRILEGYGPRSTRTSPSACATSAP